MSTSTTQFVERKGRVFRFGDHVDGKGQKFSLAREEFEAANPPGTRVPIGFDPVTRKHYEGKSAFDGKYGDVSLFANGEFVDGDYRIAPILNRAIDDEGLRVSAIFGIADKKARRIDVCRADLAIIPEAVFFAEDGSDEVAIFAEPMGMPTRRVEQADGMGSPVLMAMFAQDNHDIASSCYPSLCAGGAAFAMNEGPRKHMALIHKKAMNHGAKCPGAGKVRFSNEGGPTVAETTETVQTEVVDPTAKFAQMQAQMQAQIDALKATNARERAIRINAEAESFAKDHAAVLPPASQVFFANLYAQLADAPEDSGTVEFAHGKDQAFKGSLLTLLKTAVGQLKPHGIGGQKTVDDGKKTPLPKPAEVPTGVVLFAGEEGDTPTPDQPTPAGRAPSADRLAYLNKLA